MSHNINSNLNNNNTSFIPSQQQMNLTNLHHNQSIILSDNGQNDEEEKNEKEEKEETQRDNYQNFDINMSLHPITAQQYLQTASNILNQFKSYKNLGKKDHSVINGLLNDLTQYQLLPEEEKQTQDLLKLINNTNFIFIICVL